MKYKSRKWHAVETSNPVGSEHTLTVTGEVETLRTNEKPVLAIAHPQGTVKDPLILELSVETTGDTGGEIVRWVAVEYSHKIFPGEYRHVTVRGDVEDRTIPVEYVPS